MPTRRTGAAIGENGRRRVGDPSVGRPPSEKSWINRINRMLGRMGKVFVDRFHAWALGTPREARNGIRYVLSNWLKHDDGARGVDPYSSGRWFTGWTVARSMPETPSPTARPLTWLAAKGWRLRSGPISPIERPGRARGL